MKAVAFKKEYQGQFDAFPAVSHTTTAVALTIVVFTKEQLATQEELDLWTKKAHAEQRNVAGEPRLVVWIP